MSLFLFAMRFSFCFESFSFCREIFLFAASRFLFSREVILFAMNLFLFAVRFPFYREVNAFATTVVGHRTKVRQTTSNWIVRILYKAT